MTESISAYDIADALGLPRPTDQQRAVIEAPLEPALVVAGAGSGKTETMANRVLWLLANGHVTAGQVLGLTFTRKAAGELAQRIRERIAQLAEVGLVAGEYDEFDPPTVSTYNSFANTIYRDNAALLGRESDGAVLGEASAWQLARSIVVRSGDERLPDLEKNADIVTKAVLSLSHALSENVVDPAAVRAMALEFAALADLPSGGTGAYAEAVSLAHSVGALPVLVDLAEEFARAKKARGFVEYSDQVALALEIVRTVPSVITDFRDHYRVVLLDEYQDTSVVQTWLLSELFGGHPVMAVGDPNQSIYGWRGASAANLEEFATQFGGGKVHDFALTTSWRNGRRILDIANALVEPLVPETRVAVEKLEPAPFATDEPVDISVTETLLEEAATTAVWLKQRLVPNEKGELPSAAMLFRTRSTQRFFIEALRTHDVPFHVLGIGGLMAEPEIADLVSALAVINDPTAGTELIRLLAGSRWRLGVRDLKVLRGVSSWLNARDYAHQPLDEEVRARMRSSVAEGESGSIVDALDFIRTAREGHVVLETFSEVGLARLREAGEFFARLRARSGLELLDFVTLVEQELMLDIEVAANEFRPLGGANMEAFYDALSGYLAVDESTSLRGFLAWLAEAEWRDGLSPRPEKAEPGTVQLLTVHGSKGLEWDHVVVPRMTESELPGRPREGFTGWLSFGSLPYEFRGDAAELPVFEWRHAVDRKALLAAKGEFTASVRHRHELEERRLAYVAVTRARHGLLLTSSFWAGQNNQRPPSPFLRELAEAGVIAELPLASESEESTFDRETNELSWPLDPLGERRAAVEHGAVLVRSATPGRAGAWDADLDLLLEERRRRLEASELVDIPTRVPASRFKDFVTDPVAVASDLRRPMPQRPYRATRLGTLFHSWVEERFGLSGSTEVIDSLVSELDEQDAPLEQQQLEALQDTFSRSPWAARRPIEVEREIHLPFAGRIVICKIDAVYALQHDRFQVVDWKTGKAPRDAADLEEKQLQLALYRLAYANWTGISPDRIDAVFYYVSEDRIITPERLFDEAELLELWNEKLGS
ncbi:ATP-dependent helicase [Glaciihabitans arcticus]|uniref:DNA 3'-5' helicase n=1 Tax=Glaciihabitans arcticus TaxID=2668039 RepID=A0A4Q9GQY0_9MICO|nr:ATP-dependent DNA helicase [Glaciihabitans arcticus]TBN57316.1 ATP-dependent helicase [Glaciihabitans arcticus]